MPRTSSAIPIACFVALAAFLVAMLAGIMAGNAFATVLGRALFALLITWPVGWVIGLIIEHQFASVTSENEAEDALEATGRPQAGDDAAEFNLDDASVESDVSGVEDPVAKSELGVASGPS